MDVMYVCMHVSQADIWSNCGYLRTSMKLGTVIEHDC